MADQLSDSRRAQALTVVEIFKRECLAIDIGSGLCGHQVTPTLDRLRFERGMPQRIYCDNGPELASAAINLWAYTHGMIFDVSRRGKPTANAMIELFKGRFRADCLNAR